jgi:hypothetical protein
VVKKAYWYYFFGGKDQTIILIIRIIKLIRPLYIPCIFQGNLALKGEAIPQYDYYTI